MPAIELHIPTLSMVAVFVTIILGVLLILAWRREQQCEALLWWGASYLVNAASFGLLSSRGAIPDVLSIDIANTAVLIAYAFMLAGMRSFGGRDTPPTVFLIAPLLWLIALRVPAFASDINYRIILVSACQAAFMMLAAYELWRGRAELLLSRWPAIVVILIHTAGLLLRVPFVLTAPLSSEADFFRGSAFATMAFASVLYTITIAFLLLSLIKERGEYRQKMAALVDSLTGLANRRAFMSDADAMIEARSSRSEPLAVLLADLDHFKKINDAFGHAVGDQVLKMFAAALRGSIGANDLVGRIGGEEFAILLPVSSEAAAIQLAERARLAFAQAAAEIDGHPVAATVSIGVAASRIGVHDLAGLLGQADRALYQAKKSGRNRVAAFADDGADEAPLVPAAPAQAPFKLRIAASA